MFEIDRLVNRYFVMRHGHSLANEQGIIVSYPENGCSGFGLSESGQVQVKQSLSKVNDLDTGTRIVCSDFMRAQESAEIVFSLLGCTTSLTMDPRLRERNFGEYELSADSGYNDVWKEDALDADSRCKGVESVNQVMQRVTLVVQELEKQFNGSTILLVSHGDALQILQAAFARRDGSIHREQEHLHTAEIRQLKLAPAKGAETGL